MKTIIKMLKDKKGATFVSVAVAFLVFVMFLVCCMEGISVYITVKGTKDAMRNACKDAVTYNMYNTYNGMREGNSGAYIQNASNEWNSLNDSSSVVPYLEHLLGVSKSGNDYIKYDSYNIERYRITNLCISIINPDLSPADNSTQFTIKVDYDVKIPMYFDGKLVNTLDIPQKINAGFTPKF